jgi:hypothetical protein
MTLEDEVDQDAQRHWYVLTAVLSAMVAIGSSTLRAGEFRPFLLQFPGEGQTHLALDSVPSCWLA